MRSLIRPVVVAAALLVPQAASADIFTVTIHEPGPDFGLAGASLFPSGFDDIFIDGIVQITQWGSLFDGNVSFVTGPLESLTVDVSDPDKGSSQYVFGPGTFTLTAHWSDQFGNQEQGRYVAPLLSLVVDIPCEQQLSTVTCDSVFPDSSRGHASVSVGPGEFDANLASVLRLQKAGDDFAFGIDLDGITGGPSDDFRTAGSQSGSEDIEIVVAVPEPSILSLLLLAPVLRRFRR